MTADQPRARPMPGEVRGLKPCPVPWCREAVQISFIVSHWTGNACAECLSCKARGPWSETTEAATAAWNTRAEANPGADALVGRLVAAVDAWIKDPDTDAEQEIMDARAALSAIDEGRGGRDG